jgi:hypothetical protein
MGAITKYETPHQATTSQNLIATIFDHSAREPQLLWHTSHMIITNHYKNSKTNNKQ